MREGNDMNLQVIKIDEQYHAAMTQLDELMVENPAAGSEQATRLEVLAVLIEKYESETVDLGPVDPIEAIKFRMEQQGLSNKDLAPIFGSASKVSEVLRSKRALSLKMIRALHENLDIPYDSLMAKPSHAISGDINWHAFPLKEMLERGLFPKQFKSLVEVKEYTQECVSSFFGNSLPLAEAVAFHKSSARSGRPMNAHALAVWHALSLEEAERTETTGRFDPSSLTERFFDELAALSAFSEGPMLAKELLSRKGIRVVHVRHFNKTYLDGAALILKSDDNAPVISLTGRHDRLDNFWYVLFHELAHIKEHLFAEGNDAIFDDLDAESSGEIEQEADAIAMDALVQPDISAELARVKTSAKLKEIAEANNRHPAIYAGFLRHERKNYRIFNRLLGRNDVNSLFEY
jgi:HTH-type transcriptional regulator/antitoxin HigA